MSPGAGTAAWQVARRRRAPAFWGSAGAAARAAARCAGALARNVSARRQRPIAMIAVEPSSRRAVEASRRRAVEPSSRRAVEPSSRRGVEPSSRRSRRLTIHGGERVNIAAMHPDVVAEVEREASELLSTLIQIDTSNPPGNETAVAEFLERYFRAAGLQGEIVGEPAHRRSFVLRLPGRRPGPSLLLLAHEDVVPASPEDWTVPPFAGVIKDGYVWGRGAIDIKNLVTAHAVAVKRLAAAGADFAGTVVYAATADEEDGTVCGARWLVEHRPDLVHTDYVINEGGGQFVAQGTGRVYSLESGEKGTAQFRLTVHGEAGHASVPLRHGNAVVAAARIVQALHDHQVPLEVNDSSRELVELLVDDQDLQARLRDPARAREALAELERRDANLGAIVEPLYGFAFSPTVLRSNGVALNVYPTRVEVGVDCRTNVGQSAAQVEAELHKALAGIDAQWDLTWNNVTPGNASPYPTPLSEAIRTVLGRHVPSGELANCHSTGFTDSNWFRAAYPDAVAYNFAPHVEESYEVVAERYHAVDERIHVRDLAFQALFAEQLVLEVLK
jgi:acetylornithine deacetylase/succinyl-diaminopimelate desuccinylase-like protein